MQIASRRAAGIALAICVTFAPGCGKATPTAPSRTPLDDLLGTWRSTSIMGPCSDLSYTVTRDERLSTPRVSYTATCTPFNGGGSWPATVVGTTLAWSTGSTPGPCGIVQLNFTARLVSPSSSEVTYAGTFCDALVAGTATMQRSS